MWAGSKPIESPGRKSVAANGVDALIAAGKAANRHLAVAYRLRFEPYTQAMIKMARDNEFGKTKVILCEAGFNTSNPDQWRLKKAMGGGGEGARTSLEIRRGDERIEARAARDLDRGRGEPSLPHEVLGGVATAFDLASLRGITTTPGASVLVVEARDRVGGRLLNERLRSARRVLGAASSGDAATA